jgi:N-acyl-D-aspartate/D-glutamate deacylase
MINKINKKIQSIADLKQKEIIKSAIDELIKDHKKYGDCSCNYCYYKREYIRAKILAQRVRKRYFSDIGHVEKPTRQHSFFTNLAKRNRELMKEFE